jgi:hypothetical protein
MNSCSSIYYKDIRLIGFVTKIRFIKSFPMFEIGIEGGYENLFVFMF